MLPQFHTEIVVKLVLVLWLGLIFTYWLSWGCGWGCQNLILLIPGVSLKLLATNEIILSDFFFHFTWLEIKIVELQLPIQKMIRFVSAKEVSERKKS